MFKVYLFYFFQFHLATDHPLLDILINENKKLASFSRKLKFVHVVLQPLDKEFSDLLRYLRSPRFRWR